MRTETCNTEVDYLEVVKEYTAVVITSSFLMTSQPGTGIIIKDSLYQNLMQPILANAERL